MKEQTVVDAYSKDFWQAWPDVLDDLTAKYNNRSHVVNEKGKINNIFRAVLVFDYIKKNFPSKKATIIDAGCGVGYNAGFLLKEGYKVQAFDASDIGIQRAKELALQHQLDPNVFVQDDHTYFGKVPAESVDVVIAMGFLYYLDEKTRDYCYRQIHRILKKNGKLLVTCKNQLFDIFSLNDTSLQFWAKTVDEFSPAAQLLAPQTALEALTEKVKVPQRVFEEKSISRRFNTLRDNPLTFADDVKPYGYQVEEIVYPDPHILPPALEVEVDQVKLLELKAKYCVQKARDWRGIFLGYEFLAFLNKA